MGLLGTARAQYHLRQIFVFLNAHIMNRPEVMINQAQNKFDAEGKLIDQPARDLMATFMNAFRNWTLRMR